jgi:hypothetical protein
MTQIIDQPPTIAGACVTDEDVRNYIQRIQNNADLTKEQRYTLLDSLTFIVWNRHPQGMTAPVLAEISKAIEDQCQ